MSHLLYGLVAGHRQRRALGQLQKQAAKGSTADVDLVALKQTGVKALVFDFDGVLGPHGASQPVAMGQKALTEAQQIFGAGHVYILSNNPTSARRSWFSENFPQLIFIDGVRKKPYPDGLLKIAVLGNYQTNQIALLDDRLLTGGLACLDCGARFIYISRPCADYSAHPFKELFFATLRNFEALLARFAA